VSIVSRRSFFQGAALAASATRVVGANGLINVGIVGLGNRGFRDHLRHFLYLAGIREGRVAGLCDVNQAARERAQAEIAKVGDDKAKEFSDMRAMFDDKNIDAVSIATPNHWHALATIWACQAGKDVYVEKPASHNVHESYRMIEAARKYQRMVQVGMQSRSMPHKMSAVRLLREGVVGKVYMAKGLCFKRRKSIGKTPVAAVPPGLDWDLFLGPAPLRPFSANRYKYNWHWFWDTGNGDIGNQGAHEMDICRWGLGDAGMPKSVACSGRKYVYDDDQETPNTQLASLEYGAAGIVFEVRGLATGPEAGLPVRPGYTIGNLFLGADGWMWLDDNGFTVYNQDNVKTRDEKGDARASEILHFQNFFKACRSRNFRDLTADIEVGAVSASLVHLSNIAYRVGRTARWDDSRKKFIGDAEADKLLTRDYRKPYVVA
jgi:predicted dehydrogenase